MAKDMYQKRKERKNKTKETNNKTNINWYPGHMAKAKREIREKLELIDIVFEVVDARMPLSSKIKDIDELIKDKPRIMVMTKYDLCDKNETDKMIKYYESKGYAVLPVSLLGNFDASIVTKTASRILQSANEKRIAKGLKPRVARAIIIGVPNAGKSTLINRLVGKKTVNVGNMPGVTKSNSWIRINKDVELMDTPGILWPRFDNQEEAHILASLSSIKEDILDTEDLAFFILNKINELYPSYLEKRYGIINYNKDSVDSSLDIIATKRGALLKGGIPDYEKVYGIIIKDLKDGVLGPVTLDRMEK